MEIFLGFLLSDYLLLLFFLAWLLNGKNECDDLRGGVTVPQASMKLSPPHWSPALPRQGPHHRRCCCSPPPRHCSPAGMAGAPGASTAGTADSPAQGG